MKDFLEGILAIFGSLFGGALGIAIGIGLLIFILIFGFPLAIILFCKFIELIGYIFF